MSQTRRMKSTGRPAPSSSRTAARLSLLACAKQRLEVSRRTPSMIATPCHQGFHRLGMGQAHEPAAGRDQPLARLHVSFRRERPGQRSNPDLEVLAAVEVGPGRRTTRIERSRHGYHGTTRAKPPSVEAILDALRYHPDATAAELADAAGIGRSTAAKTLATLEARGRVTRQRGTPEGGKATTDRWTLAPDPRTEHLSAPSRRPPARCM